jgi:protoporphyrin/coproporphyrin ferrochelatase
MLLLKNKVLLLMNLGSPDSTSVKDVRKYLNEFLMDGRVIDIPVLVRTLLVKGIIVPFRAPKSAAAYRTIWTENGSPLVYLTRLLKDALQQKINMPVEICMRYGNPSPQKTFDEIAKKYPDADEVILFPLYPHYAMSSYETAAVYAADIYKKSNYPFRFSTIGIFYKQPDYIRALTESIIPYLTRPYDLLLFSYHGIPERHVKKTDITKMHCFKQIDCCNISSEAHMQCYRHQVMTTSKLVAESLQVPKEKYATSFQSRLGADAWLKPYTAERLKQLPAEGIKKLAIVCPAFVSDCLETIEEMGEEGRELFIKAGGESFTLIPCMNTQPAWVSTIQKIIELHIVKQEQVFLNSKHYVPVH